MGCFLAGRGLIDGGSVDIDLLDDTLYSDYTPQGFPPRANMEFTVQEIGLPFILRVMFIYNK
jgi:hypothetical protein